MLVCASSSTSTTRGLRSRMASTSISSNVADLYSSRRRGIVSSRDESSTMGLRPCVSTTPMVTSSPRLARRTPSLSMAYVFPTPGA
jgi:hypothetical protein